MDKQERGMPAVGGSCLLVMFAVLCLTIFALLALSTVQANGRLSQASAHAAAAYYEADCQAEEILARLRQGELPKGVVKTGEIFVYRCPISDTQTLHVEVAVSGSEYTILRWQAVSTGDWRPDDRLPVWEGGSQS